MARVTYDSSTVHGKLLAEAIDHLIRGREILARVKFAADVASNAGSDTTKLEVGTPTGGAFGAAAGQGADYWSQMVSIKSLLDADDAGGLAQFLASMDNG